MRLPGWILIAWAVVGALSNVEWAASKLRAIANAAMHPAPEHTLWVAFLGLALIGLSRQWPRLTPRLPRWLQRRATPDEKIRGLMEAIAVSTKNTRDRLDKLEDVARASAAGVVQVKGEVDGIRAVVQRNSMLMEEVDRVFGGKFSRVTNRPTE